MNFLPWKLIQSGKDLLLRELQGQEEIIHKLKQNEEREDHHREERKEEHHIEERHEERHHEERGEGEDGREEM